MVFSFLWGDLDRLCGFWNSNITTLGECTEGILSDLWDYDVEPDPIPFFCLNSRCPTSSHNIPLSIPSPGEMTTYQVLLPAAACSFTSVHLPSSSLSSFVLPYPNFLLKWNLVPIGCCLFFAWYLGLIFVLWHIGIYSLDSLFLGHGDVTMLIIM